MADFSVMLGQSIKYGHSEIGDISDEPPGTKDFLVFKVKTNTGWRKPPIYIISLAGGGGLQNITTPAVYNATSAGFEVWLTHNGREARIDAAYAKQEKWRINWLAIEVS